MDRPANTGRSPNRNTGFGERDASASRYTVHTRPAEGARWTGRLTPAARRIAILVLASGMRQLPGIRFIPDQPEFKPGVWFGHSSGVVARNRGNIRGDCYTTSVTEEGVEQRNMESPNSFGNRIEFSNSAGLLTVNISR